MFDGVTRVDAEGRITRTITLVWVGGEWRNQVTGIRIPDLNPPAESAASYGWERPAPSQPISKPARLWEIAELEKMIDQLIDRRIVSTDHYFVNDPDKLVSYRYVREVIARTDADVERLAVRVATLARPWWRRWFR